MKLSLNELTPSSGISETSATVHYKLLQSIQLVKYYIFKNMFVLVSELSQTPIIKMW